MEPKNWTRIVGGNTSRALIYVPPIGMGLWAVGEEELTTNMEMEPRIVTANIGGR